jgi:hypothetical protein
LLLLVVVGRVEIMVVLAVLAVFGALLRVLVVVAV